MYDDVTRVPFGRIARVLYVCMYACACFSLYVRVFYPVCTCVQALWDLCGILEPTNLTNLLTDSALLSTQFVVRSVVLNGLSRVIGVGEAVEELTVPLALIVQVFLSRACVRLCFLQEFS